MQTNKVIELIDSFKTMFELNNEFNISINIEDFIEGLYIEGLIKIDDINLICDCIKLIEKLNGNLKIDDINLICEKIVSIEKILANIDLINISLSCEYLKTIEKISANTYFDSINLKIYTLKTKEKINSLMKIDNINMTVSQLLLIKWRYIFEIEDDIISVLEDFNVKDIERLII